jgi:FixJ family two-component response regulator
VFSCGNVQPKQIDGFELNKEVTMDGQRRAIRAILTGMAPTRATAYIKSFELPGEEEYCIIEIDVRKRTYQDVCFALNVSPETVKKRRKDGYKKIADYINNC